MIEPTGAIQVSLRVLPVGSFMGFSPFPFRFLRATPSVSVYESESIGVRERPLSDKVPKKIAFWFDLCYNMENTAFSEGFTHEIDS